MPIRIGIPRALAYYAYYPLWKKFFEELGLEVITSQPTTKAVLDNGVKETVADACVPIKIFHGHVLDLKDKVDFIFVPRLVSVNDENSVTFCPKFLGLPDMVKASLGQLPPIIDVRIDLNKSPFELLKVCYNLGRHFDADYIQILQAYRKARLYYKQYRKLLQDKVIPLEAMKVLDSPSPSKSLVSNNKEKPQFKFAVVGFPYTVYDKFVNVDIIEKLRKLGVQVLTTEMVPPKDLLKQAGKLPKNLFWNFSNQVMRGALYYIDQSKVDGIIHITAFACGPDAMVDKMIELEAKNRGKVPFLSISIDEHTGEAGIVTRLEAFVDMLKLRRGVL